MGGLSLQSTQTGRLPCLKYNDRNPKQNSEMIPDTELNRISVTMSYNEICGINRYFIARLFSIIGIRKANNLPIL